jgi:hypothetical protein
MIKRLMVFIAAAGVMAAAELPSAEQVLSRYVEVTGGAAAYENVKTQRSSGTIEFKGMGLKAKVQTFVALPNNSSTTLDLGGLGQMRSGVKDGVAWELSPMQGPRLLEGQEREFTLRTTRLDAPIKWKELYKKVTVEAAEEVEGKSCFRLVAEPVSGGNAETSWYDVETGLLVKSRITLTSPMGEVPFETVMAEYRDAGGFKVPYKLTQRAGPQELETVIDVIEWNVTPAEGQFDFPAEIEPLVKKPAGQ